MTLNERIRIHVGTTSLNPTLVKRFLQTAPHYRQWGLSHQVSQRSLDHLNATDLFEFYLRQYLIGRLKTLQAVLRETRAFVDQDANAAHFLIRYSLQGTRQQLLMLEWYELLPRLEAARERLVGLAPELIDQLRPSFIPFLAESYEPE
ncbi:hypothetical protein [Spirosoma pollinicola]|uniref:Uncharacterized protein n=1 Tax=Spirosoma pollinicola TaxID=2057025 RepID=A0A2K8ZA45_9BACT|nr:hypothetical protein [Spirosoma pollinicola]AUD06748.1 hypothetical protein CWM47_35835 [Spirosoma pollinicola]